MVIRQSVYPDLPFGLRHYWKGHFVRDLTDELIERTVEHFAMRRGKIGAILVEPEHPAVSLLDFAAMRTMRWLVVLSLAVMSCATPVANPGAAVQPGTAAVPQPGATSGTTLAAFMVTPLLDVRSGERFTLSDFPGKVAIVEGMAVW